MKALHVIRREYVENVRRRSFILTTILVPLLMAALFAIPVLFALIEPDKQYRVALVDQTGEIAPELAAALTDTLRDGRRKYLARTVESSGDRFERARDEQVAALQTDEVDIVIAVPASVIGEGKAAYITRQERNYNVLERFEDVLTDIVIKRRLAAEGLDYERVSTLTTAVVVEMNQLTDAGSVEKKQFLGEYAVVFVFVMLLYTAILSWGVAIAKSIVEEKGSRIVEVLLSSLSARDLMVGKLVGVGLAGLTQLVIWVLAGLAMTGSAAPAVLAQVGPITVPPVTFAYFILFFILGFLLFAALFMVIGAVSSTEQDATQMQALVTLPMIIPFMSLMLFMQNPNSGLAVVMSLIPVFTPLLMLARIILLMPPFWQIALGVGLLVVSICISVSFAARVFRVGILMHGKRPSLRELLHWYRMAG
jgi:ABC-2 type transport system permease protein